MGTELNDFINVAKRVRPQPIAQAIEQQQSEEMRHFKEVASQNNIIFFFSGYISQGVIETSADAIKSRLDATRANSKVKRRLVSSFIEIAQNIVHYSADTATDIHADDDEFRFGTLCISASGENFNVMCANPVLAATEQNLGRKLELLKQMSMEDIRAAYRETLHADEGDEGSKGAGLGFLMLARDAREPIEFEFVPDPAWGSEFRMFYLKVSI